MRRNSLEWFLLLCVLVVSLSMQFAYADEAIVRIDQPTDLLEFITHDPVVNIAGTADVPYPAGVKTTVIDLNFVASADLSHANLAQSADVTIDVTTSATKVKYTGSVDLSAGLGVPATVVINGVSIDIAPGNLASIKNAINAKTAETGVTASDDGCGHLILTGGYGSAVDIIISGSGAAAVFGAAIKTAGVDAWALITDQDGYPVGGIWTGDGLTLTDDLGNHITLTERGNCVDTYMDAIHLYVCPKPYLRYTNWATGQTGNCDDLFSWTTPSLNLTPGDNLIQVQLVDGLSGDASDYITVKYYVSASTPGAARKMGDGAYVSLTDQVVTTSGPDTGTYIESADRCSGIKIVGADVPSGSIVSLDGVLNNMDGERVLSVDSISVTGIGSVAPLAVKNAAITSAYGLDTTGLLVRTSGTVVSVDDATNSVVITDGSSDGLRCVLPSSVTPDRSWRYLALTGVSANGELKVRETGDITVIK